MEIRPQPGPQEEFLQSSADICIFGGAAGAGKTGGVLIECLRHVSNPDFGAVIFRENTTQIRIKGGLWDSSVKFFLPVGGTPVPSDTRWTFPSGATVKLAHLEDDKTAYSYQGGEIPLIIFDELTHFSEFQFWYLVTRNRSTCGIRPYIRATCNPDATHFLVNGPNGWGSGLISWWIGEGGYPISERSGVIRWFVRYNEELVFADTKEELTDAYPALHPLSLTFIPGKLADNAILEAIDPGYRSRLMAQPLVERERLLEGNWKIEPTAGLVYRREWFEIVDKAPPSAKKCRHWDFAATEVNKKNKDPDWIAGVLLSVANGIYYVEDVQHAQLKPLGVEELVRQTAMIDGVTVKITAEQEPGSSGKMVIDHYARNVLQGYAFYGIPSTTKKETRAQPSSAAAEKGNIKVVRGTWNHAFLIELEAFPTKGVHDDQVDGLSGAFHALNSGSYGDYSGQQSTAGKTKVPGFGSSGIPHL